MTHPGGTDLKPDPEPAGDFMDEEGPGFDPGAAHERALEEDDGSGDTDTSEGDEPPTPGVGDVYRSGP